MSRLQDLIAQLCPNGVPYKTLGEVCVAETGQQLNRSSLLEEGEIPVYNGGIKPSGFWHEANTPANTIAISQGGASAGFVQYVTVPFWAGAHCYTVSLSSSALCYKFLYHFMKGSEPALMTSKQGAGIPGLNRKAIYALRIPVPPMAVQEEIVRILDCFTALETELETELEARKKQYAYWRERLLTFDDEADKIPCGLRQTDRQTDSQTDRQTDSCDHHARGQSPEKRFARGGHSRNPLRADLHALWHVRGADAELCLFGGGETSAYGSTGRHCYGSDE